MPAKCLGTRLWPEKTSGGGRSHSLGFKDLGFKDVGFKDVGFKDVGFKDVGFKYCGVRAVFGVAEVLRWGGFEGCGEKEDARLRSSPCHSSL